MSDWLSLWPEEVWGVEPGELVSFASPFPVPFCIAFSFFFSFLSLALREQQAWWGNPGIWKPAATSLERLALFNCKLVGQWRGGNRGNLLYKLACRPPDAVMGLTRKELGAIRLCKIVTLVPGLVERVFE